MRFFAFLLTLALVVALPALLALGRDEHDQLGSGARVAETVAHTPNPSPSEHVLELGPDVLRLIASEKPAVRARRAPTRHAVEAPGSVNGYPCGADLPPCRVLRCESGGDPTAENPTSTASGLWQILDGTWSRFGGYQRAKFAPPAIQNAKARLIWANGRGRSAWASCL